MFCSNRKDIYFIKQIRKIKEKLDFSFFIPFQQQQSSKLQLGHPLGDELVLHSSGEQLQSAHFI